MARNPSEAYRYRQGLLQLKDYQQKLGLGSTPPDEAIEVIPGTETNVFPVGSFLPAYQTTQDTDETNMEKVLFNLRSLIGFTPPTSKPKP